MSTIEEPDEELLEAVRAAVDGRSVACAESCTAGRLAQALASIEGSGEWFRGGLIAYDSTIKFSVLGVTEGPVVNLRTAIEMARGVADLLQSRLAVATTGALGPAGLDGAEPGTVAVAWVVDGAAEGSLHHFAGSPDEVAAAATTQALRSLAAAAAG